MRVGGLEVATFVPGLCLRSAEDWLCPGVSRLTGIADGFGDVGVCVECAHRL